MFTTQRQFLVNRLTPPTFTTFQSTRNKVGTSALANLREKWFELVADTREVGVDGPRFDVVAHEDCVEAQSVGCGFDG